MARRNAKDFVNIIFQELESGETRTASEIAAKYKSDTETIQFYIELIIEIQKSKKMNTKTVKTGKRSLILASFDEISLSDV